MTLESIKRRRRRALAAVALDFRRCGFDIVAHQKDADLKVSFKGEDIKAIRLCLDQITKQDLSWFCSPALPRRELWLQKTCVRPEIYTPCQGKKRT